MKLTVERKPASLVVLDITADDDEFADAMTRAIRKVSRDIQIPGFRKGKAPRALIERTYGREVFLQEAADQVMERLYRDALKQEDVTPVGEPNVEIVELEPVNFVVTVPVYPTIEAGDYTTVRVDPVDAAVGDADVDEVIERLRRAQSPWVELSEPRTPVEGDQVTVDYEVMDGDRPFQDPITDAVFVLGETNLLLQLREKIEELRPGESATFELVFDEDDETADPSIRGKTLSYTVTLKAVKERDMLPLDDEFATAVAGAESLAGLREQIREDVHQGKSADARTDVVNRIIEAMAEGATIDPPETMIDEETEHQLNHFKENLNRGSTSYEEYLRIQDTTEDEVKQELRPEAIRRLRSSLLLQELAKREGIEINDEDLDAEINRVAPPALAEGAEGEEGAAEARAQLEQMRRLYESDYFRSMLRSELFERRLTDRLIEIATEGRGAVLNAWQAPEPAAATDDQDTPEDGEADAEADPAATAAVAEADDASVAVAETPDEGSAGTDTDDAAASTRTAASKLPDEGEGTDWVAGDGTDTVPDGFPIKGNASSRIYHPEASPSYGNTIAEIYFATPEAAERAGYRLPKTLERAENAADA